ncbi:MAG: hypothetical protein JXQ29_08750 [Planctomycetes bacterium]|nr:hypothetical protein [Planctomycetota bacterium]
MAGMMRNPVARSWARLLGGLLAAAFLVACETVAPRPVSRVELAAASDSLVITWANPVDYEDVDVEVVAPDGKRLGRDRVFGYATRSGPARAVVFGVESGTYRVRVHAAVNRTRSDSRRVSEDVTCVVPQAVIGGQVTRADLGLARPEPLDVVFLIHPGSSYAAGDATGDLFRQTAASALSAAFRTAILLPDEDGLRRVEDYRERVSTDLQRASWPLDPDVLIVVDARAPTDEVSGQLAMRVLDLKLAEVLGKRPNRLDRELYNRRPLVIEEYECIVGGAHGADSREVFRTFRDAWGGLLRQVLAHPRYGCYSELLAAYKRDRRPAAIADKDFLQAFLFDALPASERPYDETEPDADPAAARFRERARKIERDFLFGPGSPAERAQPGEPGGKPPVEERPPAGAGEVPDEPREPQQPQEPDPGKVPEE